MIEETSLDSLAVVDRTQRFEESLSAAACSAA
jgi:hypothetical protein